MFVALWEFEVKPGCEERFERVYGPDGDWAKLFRSDSNYQKSRLLRDTVRNSVYVTLDYWNSRKAYEQFLETDAADYKNLDAAGKEMTLREAKIAWFEEIQDV